MDEDDTGLKTLRRRAAISYIITALVVVATAADVIAESAYIYGWSDFWAWQIGDVYLVDQLFMSSAAVLLVSMVLNSFWIYQAHRNMWVRSDENMEISPGWAIGWYAAPIANLFKPFQAMRELYRMSLQEDDTDAPPLLWAWWIPWLLSGFIGFGSDEEYTLFDIAAGMFTIVSAICLMLIIRRVTKAQHAIPMAAVFD